MSSSHPPPPPPHTKQSSAGAKQSSAGAKQSSAGAKQSSLPPPPPTPTKLQKKRILEEGTIVKIYDRSTGFGVTGTLVHELNLTDYTKIHVKTPIDHKISVITRSDTIEITELPPIKKGGKSKKTNKKKNKKYNKSYKKHKK